MFKKKVEKRKATKLMQYKRKYHIEVDQRNQNIVRCHPIEILKKIKKVEKNHKIFKIEVKFRKNKVKERVPASEAKVIEKMDRRVQEKVTMRKVK